MGGRNLLRVLHPQETRRRGRRRTQKTRPPKTQETRRQEVSHFPCPFLCLWQVASGRLPLPGASFFFSRFAGWTSLRSALCARRAGSSSLLRFARRSSLRSLLRSSALLRCARPRRPEGGGTPCQVLPPPGGRRGRAQRKGRSNERSEEATSDPRSGRRKKEAPGRGQRMIRMIGIRRRGEVMRKNHVDIEYETRERG